MKTVTVTASKNYDVLIGNGLLCELGLHIMKLKSPCKVAVISDDTVAPLYMDTVVEQLTNAGFLCCKYIFPAGETSKNGQTYLNILDFLALNKLTRSDFLIALGGGVVGDMTGFVAATYLRGIDYIQIPTTLLAMVDSSVGGKTAIDLPSGKNLAGAFYQPKLVLCDIETLSTLPHGTFRDGCAEVIKYGILFDEILFSHLEKHGIDFDREYVITRCVALKRDIVCEDEFDTGKRQLLNLGHTIGHGIEAISNYSVSHGCAVSIGTAAICRASAAMQALPKITCKRILKILESFQLPIISDHAGNKLLPYILGDKKRSSNTINLIIPHDIGQCEVTPTPIDKLNSIIEAGL